MTEATSGYLNIVPRGYDKALVDRLTVQARAALRVPITEVESQAGEVVSHVIAAGDWAPFQAILNLLEDHIDRCDAEQAAIDEAEGRAMDRDAFSAQFRR